jgi:hypothetical protein
MSFSQNIKYIDPPRRLERRAMHVLFVVLVLFLLESLGGSPAHADEKPQVQTLQQTEVPFNSATPAPGSMLPEKLKRLQELQADVDKEVEDLRQLYLQKNPPPPVRPASELAKNFGIVYGTQWAVYLITQHETIEEHGSWENFFSYPLRPDFDKDSFDYNILKHALSGNYYYLFYRSRGYSETESFAWTFMSSLAFEFAVETFTEQPSYQDIYQTPIYGTLVGMGAERIGNYLFSSDSKIVRAFGYLFNPFELIKVKKETEVVAYPSIEKETLGMNVSWRF